MEDLTLKEKKCVRYLAGEMTKEDEVVFEIELSIDNELLNLYNRYKTIWSLYPTQKEYLHQHFTKNQKLLWRQLYTGMKKKKWL